MYSDTVRRLVAELPNRGTLEKATHFARAENPVCGDITELYLRVSHDVVQECRFKADGCPAAIAGAAALTLLCCGKTTSQCLQLTSQDLLDFLQGLPEHKMHGIELSLEVLRKALDEMPRGAASC